MLSVRSPKIVMYLVRHRLQIDSKISIAVIMLLNTLHFSTEMSEDFLVAQVTAFLIGGFDTTAANMSWIIYTLAWHSEYQVKQYLKIAF